MSKLNLPEKSPLSRQWPIFWVMVTATLFASFHQIGLSTISGEISEALSLNPAQLGSLAAIFAIAYASMQIPAGLLADTVGSRKSVTCALAIAICGTFLFASATTFTQAAIGRALIGIGVAVISIPLIKLTVEWFKPQQFAKITAYSFTIQSFGFLLATSPVALISGAIGWRMTYYGLGFITLVSALSIFIVVRDRPDLSDSSSTASANSSGDFAGDSAGDSSGDSSGNPTDAVTGNVTSVSSPRPTAVKLSIKETLLTTLKQKQLWVLGGWYALQGGIFYSFIGIWAGQFLTVGYGLSVQQTGLILMIPACAIMTSPLFVALAYRIGSQRNVVIALSIATFILSLPLPFVLPQLPNVLFSLYFFALATSNMGGVAIIFTMGKEVLPAQYAGTATGLINIFPFLGGAVLQQLIGGLIELQSETPDLEVFAHAFTVFPFFALGSVVLALCTTRQPKP